MRRLPATLALLALTGCGTPAQPAARPAPTEQPAAAPTTATPGPTAVGHKQTSSDNESSLDVTVLRLRVPFTGSVPPDRKGYIHAGIEIKLCVTRNTGPRPISVSWSPWSLSYRSGVVVEPVSSWSPDAWKEPLYPQDHFVPTGRCARGWIPFEVRPGDGRPDLVTYAPTGATPVEWAVPA